MNLYIDAFAKIWKDLLFKIAGNLFPFYIGAFVLLFLKKEDVYKVLDPQSFILYSSTFLFSTLYLWFKTLDNKKNELISLLIFLLLLILIALLYSFSLMDKTTANIDIAIWAYIIFTVSLLFYIFYECKAFLKVNATISYSESNKQFNNLKDSFKNFKENE
jgi:O-antigen ligase